MSPRVMEMCYNFIEACVSFSKLYKIIKPLRHFILLESIFPTLCLNDNDLELWRDDPHEFVRKSLGKHMPLSSLARTAAAAFAPRSCFHGVPSHT